MRLRAFSVLCGFLLLPLSGCGDSNIGYVRGTVTLDGKPLEGALVTFIPEEGRPAYGRTDADGRYVLQYTRGKKGTLVGKNIVQITTERAGDPDAEDAAFRKPVRERIPAKYNVNTELSAEVESGSNTFDFDLKSTGKIISEKTLIRQSSPE